MFYELVCSQLVSRMAAIGASCPYGTDQERRQSLRLDPIAEPAVNDRNLRIPLKKSVIHCRWGDLVIQ